MQGSYTFLVGIDSGTNTGMAVWHRPSKKFVFMETMLIHRAMDKVKEFYVAYPGRVYVRVEDANKATGGRAKDAYRAKGAGSIMRDGRIWRDFLTDYDIPHEMCKPDRFSTKMNGDLFNRTTGITGRTTSHARDAGMLVYGL